MVRSSLILYDICFIYAEVLGQVNAVLNQCSSGMDSLLKHEAQLFNTGILQESAEEGWKLLELEQTLLTLGSYKDMTKAVFYCLVLPGHDCTVVR